MLDQLSTSSRNHNRPISDRSHATDRSAQQLQPCMKVTPEVDRAASTGPGASLVAAAAGGKAVGGRASGEAAGGMEAGGAREAGDCTKNDSTVRVGGRGAAGGSEAADDGELAVGASGVAAFIRLL